MSLTIIQQQNTIHEFQDNLKIAGLTEQTAAIALKTSSAKISGVIQLKQQQLEDAWIFRKFLLEKIKQENKKAVPFTALVSDHHDYWVLILIEAA